MAGADDDDAAWRMEVTSPMSRSLCDVKEIMLRATYLILIALLTLS